MAKPKQPIELIQSKGKKHLTKAEIEKRTAEEVKPCTEDIEAPSYLNVRQKKEFDKIAKQLSKLNVLGETDVDALARFILARGLYVKLTKQLMKKEVIGDPVRTDLYMKNQQRAFNQCRESANDLGLTITSRCRLVAPKAAEQEVKENKFAKFAK